MRKLFFAMSWIAALSMTVWFMVGAVVAGLVHGFVKYTGMHQGPAVDSLGLALGAMLGGVAAVAVIMLCTRDTK